MYKVLAGNVCVTGYICVMYLLCYPLYTHFWLACKDLLVYKIKVFSKLHKAWDHHLQFKGVALIALSDSVTLQER